MQFATWTEDLETGNLMVDAQHRRLFDLLNDLHDDIVEGRDAETVGRTIAELRHYATTHFADEESLMARVEYPHTAIHHALHEELRESLDEMAASYRAGELTLGITLALFLREWLDHHIGEHDRALADFVRAAA